MKIKVDNIKYNRFQIDYSIEITGNFGFPEFSSTCIELHHSWGYCYIFKNSGKNSSVSFNGDYLIQNELYKKLERIIKLNKIIN